MAFFERMRPEPFNGESGSPGTARLSRPSFPAALILLWAVLTLSSLGAAPLFDYDEAAHAETAVEMTRDHRWLLPTLNGRPFYEKPAVLFYFMGASLALFGKNAFAARLPSALWTLATALYLFSSGLRLGRRSTGWTASLVYVSMLMPALLAHAAIFDPMLNFWIAVSILSFFLWRRSGKLSDAVVSMFAAGVAVSVKGPVGAVVPFMVIVLDRLAAKEFVGTLRLFPWKRALPAFLAGALPWYALVSIVYGFGFLKEFILVENFHRFAHPMEGHSGGWYYYFLILVPSTLPWVAWLPWWIRQTVARWAEQEEPDHLSRMCLIWTTAVIVLFTLSQTKLPHYISSIYPAVALGVASRFERQQPGRSWVRAASFILAAVCVPLALFLLALPGLYPHIADMARHPRAVAVLTQPIRPGFGTAAGGAVLLAALVVVLRQARRSGPSKTLALYILFGFLLQSTLIWSLAPWAGRLMQGQLLGIAAAIRTTPAAEPVYSLVNCPSVSFYSGRPYEQVNAGDLERLTPSSASYLLIARTGDLQFLSFAPLKILRQYKDYALLSYDPA